MFIGAAETRIKIQECTKSEFYSLIIICYLKSYLDDVSYVLHEVYPPVHIASISFKYTIVYNYVSLKNYSKLND